MEINKIIVASPMYKEIQEILNRKGVKKNFRFYSDEEVTQEDLNWADAFVSFSMKDQFDYHNLKWVHSLGAGVDRFLFGKEWPTGVLLTRTVCSFGQRIGEYCLSYLLKDLQLHDRFQTLKEQKQWKPKTPLLLSEQKVMIYGTGEIGQTTAKILSQFGVKVYGVSLSGENKEHFNEVMNLENHYEKLSEMDFLINTLPLTAQTVNLFNEEILNKLTGVGLINVGRGATVNEKALLAALHTKHVRFAVLDVFIQEPLSDENDLWSHPNVFITPHISAVTTPSEGVECFIETLIKVEGNRPLSNIVDVKRGY
ncbi:Phosphoglycerate dehydrogenase [Mesobacillus persicus]|uniref:Phosphoglycerate dehydrogenase n=1 Tax=Mesobacillus persicus TaxID=930146 RepID=A0A1H7W5B4_9BACI|nr:D-2-hydroxyacid dehydrogenase [Mesobacillus persicus]SEM16255.1 Phosphoglycerate dehydrogenase [Mesobacillus persicus]